MGQILLPLGAFGLGSGLNIRSPKCQKKNGLDEGRKENNEIETAVREKFQKKNGLDEVKENGIKDDLQ